MRMRDRRAKCSKRYHKISECNTTQFLCCNCDRPPAYSRSFDNFKHEKEITNLKVTRRLSYQEARKQHLMLPSGSHADIALPAGGGGKRGRGASAGFGGDPVQRCRSCPILAQTALAWAPHIVALLPVDSTAAVVAKNAVGGDGFLLLLLHAPLLGLLPPSSKQ